MVSGIPILSLRLSPGPRGDQFVARQPFERFSDRIAASFDLVLDVLGRPAGVLRDVFEDAHVQLVSVDLDGVDQAQLELLGVPVGGRLVEAADIVAARLDPELRVLGVDVDPEAGGPPLKTSP
jgi:hypothetical protein